MASFAADSPPESAVSITVRVRVATQIVKVVPPLATGR